MATPTQRPEIVRKEQALARNVGTLLEIVSSLTESRDGVESEFGASSKGTTDKSARFALDTTIIQACNRLDALLEDSSNWDSKVQDEMMKAVTKTHELQHEFLKAQRESALAVQKPSFQLRPTLVNCGSQFYAIYGDPGTKGGAIIGEGLTPAAALADFDAAFSRIPSDQKTLTPVSTPVKKKRNEKS